MRHLSTTTKHAIIGKQFLSLSLMIELYVKAFNINSSNIDIVNRENDIVPDIFILFFDNLPVGTL